MPWRYSIQSLSQVTHTWLYVPSKLGRLSRWSRTLYRGHNCWPRFYQSSHWASIEFPRATCLFRTLIKPLKHHVPRPRQFYDLTKLHRDHVVLSVATLAIRLGWGRAASALGSGEAKTAHVSFARRFRWANADLPFPPLALAWWMWTVTLMIPCRSKLLAHSSHWRFCYAANL